MGIHTISCVICNKSFTHVMPHTKYCSDKCRKQKFADDNGRHSYADGISTGTVGAIVEMRVAIKLMEMGFAVFRSLSPACFCDLIAIKDRKQLRVEVRTGYLSRVAKTYSFPKTKHGEIDLFGVYFGRIDKVIFFDESGKMEVNLQELETQ